jgi:AcrR family transcriptional regulator
MARPKDLQRREDLLDAVVDSLGADGLGTRSLRDLAAAAGTTHRMLIHHFGSREGLLLAVVEEVEARQRARMASLDPGAPTFLAEMWAELCAPANTAAERLFFECYARGAAGEMPFAAMHPGSVHTWLREAETLGLDPVLARLGLAVVRGLLLDLAATGEASEVSEALDRFAALLRAGAGPEPPAPATGSEPPRSQAAVRSRATRARAAGRT